MKNIQFQTLDAGNGEELIVLQKKVWKRILGALEELEDIAAYDKAKANPNKEFLAHPTSVYLDLWMARILSLKYSWSRKP